MLAREALKRFSTSLKLSAKLVRSKAQFETNLQHIRAMSSSKSPLNISGVYPPIATPFDGNEDISWKKLEQNMNKWNKFDFAGKMHIFVFNYQYCFIYYF